MASNGPQLSSNPSQSPPAIKRSASNSKSQSAETSVSSCSSSVSKRSRSRIPVRTGGSSLSQRRSRSVSSYKSSKENSMVSSRLVSGLSEATASEIAPAQAPVMETGIHMANSSVPLPSQRLPMNSNVLLPNTAVSYERPIARKEVSASAVSKAIEMPEPAGVSERLLVNEVVSEFVEMPEPESAPERLLASEIVSEFVEPNGVHQQPLAKGTDTQMSMRNVENEGTVAITTELVSPPIPAFVNLSSEQLTNLVPLHNIYQLHEISPNRYVERGVWLQHFANKVREVEVHLGPPPTEIETKTTKTCTGTAAESMPSSDLPELSSEVLPSDTSAPSRAPGSSFASSVMEHEPSYDSERYETRLLPLAGYTHALSTADEEKTDDIPKSSAHSSISTQMSSYTEATFDGKVEFSSSYASSIVPASAEEPEVAPVTQLASKLESIQGPSAVKLSQLSGWNLSAGSLEAREFIAKMMHPSPPMIIETVDMSCSHDPIDFVYVNPAGKITRVCSSVAEPKDTGDDLD